MLPVITPRSLSKSVVVNIESTLSCVIMYSLTGLQDSTCSTLYLLVLNANCNLSVHSTSQAISFCSSLIFSFIERHQQITLYCLQKFLYQYEINQANHVYSR